MIEETSPGVGGAMDLERVDGSGGKKVLVKLWMGRGQRLAWKNQSSSVTR